MARTCISRAFGLKMSCCLSLVVRLFCFVLFRLYTFIEAAAPRSIILRYACASTVACVTSVSPSLFLFLWRWRFFQVFLYHCRSLFVWRVRCTFFLPDGVFLPCAHGLDFCHQLIQEFNQSISITVGFSPILYCLHYATNFNVEEPVQMARRFFVLAANVFT